MLFLRRRNEWRPLKEALQHRPFDAGGEEYRLFIQKTREKIAAFSEKYPNFALAGEGSNAPDGE